MNNDTLEIEITEDGTIKTTTGKVSAANHQNAEAFLQFMARLAGGQTTRQKRPYALHHTHQHEHARENQ